jgi:predicted nuclease of predicted toxin-antitoxin system
VDAHLPASLCAVLARHGHDANHTLDLLAKNATKDTFLNQISVDEQRVVISKDSDFFYSPKRSTTSLSSNRLRNKNATSKSGNSRKFDAIRKQLQLAAWRSPRRSKASLESKQCIAKSRRQVGHMHCGNRVKLTGENLTVKVMR